jgi:copper transport protein
MTSFATLVDWPQPLLELAGFMASFLATGAVGFRFVVIRPWLGGGGSAPDDLRAFARRSVRTAAILGCLGGLAILILHLADLHAESVERHVPWGTVLGSKDTPLALGLEGGVFLGFALAAAGAGAGWYLAAAGVILGTFLPALSGQWLRLVNPIHVLAGGFWIGTLFLVVTAAILPSLRSDLSPERRGPFVRDLVARFSPLALGSAGVLATFGVITAWRHLKTLRALWTTPYGITLIVKLGLVACVLALGAFNFRRQRPLLGTDAGARSLRGSASAELAMATLVLIVTSLLVSMPSPKAPSAEPSKTTAAAGK